MGLYEIEVWTGGTNIVLNSKDMKFAGTGFRGGDDARYILGQTLTIDGGTTSWISFGEGFREPSDAPFGRGYAPGV